MKGIKMLKALLIIISIILVLGFVFLIWFIKVPTGIMLFPKLAETSLNSFIEYKWDAGNTSADNIQCILKFDSGECKLIFSGKGELLNFDNGDTKSWHSLNSMTSGWVAPIRSVIIENGITSIGEYTFPYMTLNNIHLPDSIEYIAANAFINCNNSSSDSITIIYKGSIEQWNSIKKEENWCDEHSKSSIKTIKCSDGEILLQ